MNTRCRRESGILTSLSILAAGTEEAHESSVKAGIPPIIILTSHRRYGIVYR